MNTFFIEKTYIITVVLKNKIKYFNENFITHQELNYISNCIQSEFNKKYIKAIIIDKIDGNLFLTNDVITLNKQSNVSLEGIEKNFYCPRIDILSILFDEKYICDNLIQLRENEKIKTLIKK